jgi:hypothetical protein
MRGDYDSTQVKERRRNMVIAAVQEKNENLRTFLTHSFVD